jgi:hypothetical protein
MPRLTFQCWRRVQKSLMAIQHNSIAPIPTSVIRETMGLTFQCWRLVQKS